MKMDDFYEILEISEDASIDEIKKAYRKLAKKYHPDKGGDEDMFKKVKEAYEILSDIKKRENYNKKQKDSDYSKKYKSDNNYDDSNNFRKQSKSEEADILDKIQFLVKENINIYSFFGISKRELSRISIQKLKAHYKVKKNECESPQEKEVVDIVYKILKNREYCYMYDFHKKNSFKNFGLRFLELFKFKRVPENERVYYEFEERCCFDTRFRIGFFDGFISGFLIPIPMNIFFYFAYGQTIMDLYRKTKLVDAKTGKVPSFFRLIIRFLAKFISYISLIGFIMADNQDRRALHDIISGTLYVKLKNNEKKPDINKQNVAYLLSLVFIIFIFILLASG